MSLFGFVGRMSAALDCVVADVTNHHEFV
jgi:hypothetical protein